jgi:hypothetical protein
VVVGRRRRRRAKRGDLRRHRYKNEMRVTEGVGSSVVNIKITGA